MKRPWYMSRHSHGYVGLVCGISSKPGTAQSWKNMRSAFALRRARGEEEEEKKKTTTAQTGPDRGPNHGDGQYRAVRRERPQTRG